MALSKWLLLLVLCGLVKATPLLSQMPFYTDNADVTDRGTIHIEIFNEADALQFSLQPDVRQNTANFKANYGLPHQLEFDVDVPYLSIHREQGSTSSSGIGDTELGVKWNFRKAARPLRGPALASSFYLEFPTGSPAKETGSGLSDYWLNFIAEEPLSDKTRVTGNVGFLFAGNTSTGVIGIQTTRGHVYTFGLSLLHDFSPRLMLGSELYGGFADNVGLGKDQFQGMLGGQYLVRDGLGVTFGLLGGAHVASPRIGGQIGVAVDFPAVLHRKSAY